MQQLEKEFDIETYVLDIAKQARLASRDLARTDTQKKNNALILVAELIKRAEYEILQANEKDVELSERNNLNTALVDRLRLNHERIESMTQGLIQIAELPDPIGEISRMNYRPTGIQVGRMRVPLGVIGMIYESRPNVTADAAGLCLKSGNAVILRGGSESLQTNLAIARCINEGLHQVGLPQAAIQMIEVTDRAAVGMMLRMPEYIDIVVPRGGKGLIERIARESQIPMIKHLDGVCHVYLDNEANLDKALAIAVNAKTQRYGTCNTMETLLVHKNIAGDVLPKLESSYLQAGVELRGCEATRDIIRNCGIAEENDWYTEYLAPILSIRVVAHIDQAIDHITQYGSQHTDAIVTENISKARRFLAEVDSSSVMVNASTRFADGFEYGLGAEIGISTDKLHARGPVGLEGLTSEKYVVFGDGHIRQ